MDTLFDQYRLELTVTDVKRGQEAWALAVAGNRFNKKPEAGKEYLLVTYKIKVLDSADGKAVSLNNALFKFVSQKGVKYNDFVSLAGLKPALTDLYKGGEAEGIVYGMVDEGDQPLVVFLERTTGAPGSPWNNRSSQIQPVYLTVCRRFYGRASRRQAVGDWPVRARKKRLKA